MAHFGVSIFALPHPTQESHKPSAEFDLSSRKSILVAVSCREREIDMTAEPVWVEAPPATSEPNPSGPAEDDQFLQLLSQLLVSDRPPSELLEETKQLARNLSKPGTNTEAEPPPTPA